MVLLPMVFQNLEINASVPFRILLALLDVVFELNSNPVCKGSFLCAHHTRTHTHTHAHTHTHTHTHTRTHTHTYSS